MDQPSESPNSNQPDELPLLYTELASWFHLLSDPADYLEEVVFFHQVLSEAIDPPPQTMLELGSGGGNNASHLKAHYQMTLTDRSAGMLALSRTLNPECEHIEGDMRTLRLGRLFDAVFIHDAIEYLITLEDLRQALETAYLHCRPGGVALFVPDHVSEIFRPDTEQGGGDGETRRLRYLEWTHPPRKGESFYRVDFVYLLQEGEGEVRIIHDQHRCGLFPRADWLRLLAEVGFHEVRVVTDPFERELFVAIRPPS
jgi:SAM-dependent methyltransferase